MGENVVQMQPRSRAKEVPVTPQMVEVITRISGVEIDAEQIAVFETVAANSLPLTKPGSIFDKGVFAPDTLRQMARSLNAGEVSVPLHTLHNNTGELPVGRVFQADVIDGQLHALFYLSRETDAELIEKINTGIIDEVSVGFVAKQILCSECGFDYRGPEASILNFIDRTCANDHVVGENGCHVELVGLDQWYELSLVSRGAARNPKILGRAKQVLGQETVERLAAEGTPLEMVALFAGAQIKEDAMSDKPQETAGVKLEEIAGQLSAIGEKLQQFDPAKLEQIEAAMAKIDALEAKIDGLEAKIPAAPVVEPQQVAGQENVPEGALTASAIQEGNTAEPSFPVNAFKTH